MAGTREGGLKSAATLKAKKPNHFAVIGRKGGEKKVAKGYSMDRTRARLSGYRGAQVRHTKTSRSIHITVQ